MKTKSIHWLTLFDIQVLAFNGKPVKNLSSLASMVESCNDDYLKFDLEYQQVLSLSLNVLAWCKKAL